MKEGLIFSIYVYLTTTILYRFHVTFDGYNPQIEGSGTDEESAFKENGDR